MLAKQVNSSKSVHSSAARVALVTSGADSHGVITQALRWAAPFTPAAPHNASTSSVWDQVGRITLTEPPCLLGVLHGCFPSFYIALLHASKTVLARIF